MEKWAAVVLAAPGSLLAAVSAAALMTAVFGAHPMWPHEALNLSEAAALNDEGQVAMLIGAGEDPDAPREVRAGLLGTSTVRLTPLEAAVAASDPSMIHTLLMHGAAMDARAWSDLRCAADDEGVARMLDAQRPAGATAPCEAALP
jgi:hypothetical protein